MKPRVNQELCIGSGSCNATCPEVFKLVDGKSQVLEGVDYEALKSSIDEAIAGCPVQAISWGE